VVFKIKKPPQRQLVGEVIAFKAVVGDVGQWKHLKELLARRNTDFTKDLLVYYFWVCAYSAIRLDVFSWPTTSWDSTSVKELINLPVLYSMSFKKKVKDRYKKGVDNCLL